MKRLLAILPILALLATSCYKEPYAEVVVTPNPAFVGEDIEFTNLSLNGRDFEWNLGDGTTSTYFDLVHYYVDPGKYTASLSAYGKKGDASTVYFDVDVTGSSLTVEVRDYETEALIQDASVVLFHSLNAWDEANYDNIVAEAFTDGYGECTFSNLSYQRYYVDVYWRSGDVGWVNWILGAEDVVWIETQMLPGGYNHKFIAYVDYVTFTDKKKSAGEDMVRPDVRPPLKDLSSNLKSTGVNRPLKENKSSVKVERK
ncbi:MAG: PKD domain-containing protein [Bacteroidales bacterium]